VEATAEVSKTFNEKIRKYCDTTLQTCAYAGTGMFSRYNLVYNTNFL
jgi:hypothetical protein